MKSRLLKAVPVLTALAATNACGHRYITTNDSPEVQYGISGQSLECMEPGVGENPRSICKATQGQCNLLLDCVKEYGDEGAMAGCSFPDPVSSYECNLLNVDGSAQDCPTAAKAFEKKKDDAKWYAMLEDYREKNGKTGFVDCDDYGKDQKICGHGKSLQVCTANNNEVTCEDKVKYDVKEMEKSVKRGLEALLPKEGIKIRIPISE